jgi:hypothetical protein
MQPSPAHAGKSRPIRFVENNFTAGWFRCCFPRQESNDFRAGFAFARDQFPCARETLALWAHLASGDLLALPRTALGNRHHAARSPDHDNFTAGPAVSRPERGTFQWRCMRGSRHLRSGFRKLLRPMILFRLLERLPASDIFLVRPILHSGSRCMGSTRWRRRHICQRYEG